MDGSALFNIAGIRILNQSKGVLVQTLKRLVLSRGDHLNRSVFFINANNFNIAQKDVEYRRILNRGTLIIADGVGIRFAACTRNIELEYSKGGTELVPAFLQATSWKGLRYFLLGGTHMDIQLVTAKVLKQFPGWKLAGYHHGFFNDVESKQVISSINDAVPDLLLIGMGTPHQEKWFDRHRSQFQVPLTICVGGLFSYWGGKLRRAPLCFQRLGLEWTWILFQQPHKWQRYLIGNWQFISSVASWKLMRNI